jgi:hypothetical protein
MVEYSTIYWIAALIIFIVFNIEYNSFDDGYNWPFNDKLCRYLHSFVMCMKMQHSTFVSRFRVGVLFYIISWIIWFIIF